MPELPALLSAYDAHSFIQLHGLCRLPGLHLHGHGPGHDLILSILGHAAYAGKQNRKHMENMPEDHVPYTLFFSGIFLFPP